MNIRVEDLRGGIR